MWCAGLHQDEPLTTQNSFVILLIRRTYAAFKAFLVFFWQQIEKCYLVFSIYFCFCFLFQIEKWSDAIILFLCWLHTLSSIKYWICFLLDDAEVSVWTKPNLIFACFKYKGTKKKVFAFRYFSFSGTNPCFKKPLFPCACGETGAASLLLKNSPELQCCVKGGVTAAVTWLNGTERGFETRPSCDLLKPHKSAFIPPQFVNEMYVLSTHARLSSTKPFSIISQLAPAWNH